jgi:hypothetical protein
MKEKEISIPGGSMVFALRGEEAELDRVTGQVAALEVPEVLPDGERVTKIGRKSVLGKKQLRRVVLPAGIREVGDWAFASCSNLKTVTMPAAELGKGAFLDCHKLEDLRLAGSESGDDEDTAALLAYVARESDTGYLQDLKLAGSGDWLQKWDARLMKILREADQEGFSRQILCGEEDYGVTDITAYESGRRVRKAELSMLRLLHDRGLAEGIREQLTEYLLDHCRKDEGGKYGDETWQMIRGLHGEDRDWYQHFVSLGCTERGDLDRMLSELGEDHPEMKSYLLGSRDRDRATGFFDNLAL